MKITEWEIYTGSPIAQIEKALEAGDIKANDIVFCGTGGIVIVPTPADLEGDEVEMLDSGTVEEYLNA